MTKYKIEGGLDFFNELYKCLDEECNDNEENVCLITNLPLIDHYVNLECGHKFNYMPLFKDIKNHKQKYNIREGKSTYLKTNEIRCPYCRKKQKGVLPYYEEFGLSQIEGVNYLKPNMNTKITSPDCTNSCEFLTPEPNYNSNSETHLEPNVDGNINCKFNICKKKGSKINFFNGIVSGENYGDDKNYCWNHKQQMIKKYKKEAKQLKTLEKEEAKNQIKEEKQKLKAQKNKKITAENVVLGDCVIDVSSNLYKNICVEILKTGKNKGKQCGCNTYKNNRCKRHNNFKKDDEIIV